MDDSADGGLTSLGNIKETYSLGNRERLAQNCLEHRERFNAENPTFCWFLFEHCAGLCHCTVNCAAVSVVVLHVVFLHPRMGCSKTNFC